MEKIARKGILYLLTILSVISFALITPILTVHAQEFGSVQKPQNTSVKSVPTTRTHQVMKVTTSPGPYSIPFYDTIDGVFYEGTLYKVDEQIDPTGPYYLTIYKGTVTRVR